MAFPFSPLWPVYFLPIFIYLFIHRDEEKGPSPFKLNCVYFMFLALKIVFHAIIAFPEIQIIGYCCKLKIHLSIL